MTMFLQTDSKTEPAPPSHCDWDPIAALEELTGGDAEGFMSRLHQAAETYARAPQDHLSFEEIQGVAAGDSQRIQRHAAHLEACEYCAGLRETLAPTPAAQHAFSTLVESYERPTVEDERTAACKSTPGKLTRWLTELPAWGGALAAVAAAGVVALSFLFGFVYQNAHYSRLDDPEIAASQSLVIGVNAVALEHNWTDIRRDCAQQSAQRETCDLLASAAELQLAYGENKSRAAGPVVLAALQKAPVSEPVIIHVKGALDTRPATDPKTRERLRQEIQALLAGHVKDRAPPPETWITAAKLQFQAGESVAGFESLVHYVATDNTDTARALKVGFVDPIKVADRQQSKNKSSLLLKPPVSSGEDTSEKDSPQG
jgi:hypothetical protein